MARHQTFSMPLLPDLSTRLREDEWMDAPEVEPQTLHRSLQFIQRVNTFLRYTRATLWHLERFSRSWNTSEPISILDVATGSADIPRAIAEWAKSKSLNVSVVGLDRHPVTARIAREQSDPDGALRIVRGDALHLPFDDSSFDYVITHMFLHHLDDDDVVRVLSEMNRVARRGILWADLLRHRRAYLWIKLLTTMSTPMVKHDAPLSVAQAFNRSEVLTLRDRAGIGYTQYFRHFGHRFVLAGEK
jgi:ubiquinone/menaquinone biosynthesis C-methylase UbiE